MDFFACIQTLQRILFANGLRRRGHPSDLINVVNAVDEELVANRGKALGYRAMQQRLTMSHGLTTNRETVRKLLVLMDPEGVQRRRQRRLHRREYRVKGLNFLWHIDGWDKLKAFGLCVHGCIDGFSRRILWLEVSATNNDPYVICSYFAHYCEAAHGIPQKIRADFGTENVNVEIMQTILRKLNNDNVQASANFLYGKSTHNQRIEAWWSKFKQLGMYTWIEHSKDLSDSGVIDTSNEMDIQAIRYCYMSLLSEELTRIRQLWNVHYIRKSRACESPGGKPDVMYYLPGAYDTKDYLKPFQIEDMEYVKESLCCDVPTCQELYRELFSILMEEGNRSMPQTLGEAQETLVYILDAAQNEFENV